MITLRIDFSSNSHPKALTLPFRHKLQRVHLLRQAAKYPAHLYSSTYMNTHTHTRVSPLGTAANHIEHYNPHLSSMCIFIVYIPFAKLDVLFLCYYQREFGLSGVFLLKIIIIIYIFSYT